MRQVDTPCFVFSESALAGQWNRLRGRFDGLPVRHWWSFKTLPLRPAIQWWREQGQGVEVVSEFEWRGARALGFEPDRILVNGPAKHTWLPNCAQDGMRVNFDSVEEIRALAPLAKRHRWRIGVRLNTRSESHAEFPGVRTQFGLMGSELNWASRWLRAAGLRVEVVHFHLRTQVSAAAEYRDAMEEALRLCGEQRWQPDVLDIGGGAPAQSVLDRGRARLDAQFSWSALRREVTAVLGHAQGVREVWMENGRWLTAPSGVLAVRICDVKEGRGMRTLICDGGRTLHAMVATWEGHTVESLEAKKGRRVRTLICGPTCMSFDNLGEHRLPRTLRPGEVLIWRDAGAYQICWETRFSHGLAPVVWCGRKRVEVVRSAETFESWWASR
ncbi:MAG: hypothetical protein JNK85_19120 [Verrucomicrobiales bacterium]|nr:hypothetical protein [Verrucomicrobiales bacterium]